jgi:hypothetical protein
MAITMVAQPAARAINPVCLTITSLSGLGSEEGRWLARGVATFALSLSRAHVPPIGIEGNHAAISRDCGERTVGQAT